MFSFTTVITQYVAENMQSPFMVKSTAFRQLQQDAMSRRPEKGKRFPTKYTVNMQK